MAAPIRVPTANMALLSDDKSQPTSIESVAAILTRCKAALIEDWLVRTKKTPDETYDHLRIDKAALGFARAALFGEGPFSRFPHEGGAFLKTDPGAASPDV